MTRWLSTGLVGRRFGVHPQTISRWVREGRFPRPIHMAEGKHRFWLVEEIEEWERQKLEERG